MSTSLSLRKKGCKSASYMIYTLYYTHKKVRLSVFYLTIHKYSLNCKKRVVDHILSLSKFYSS